MSICTVWRPHAVTRLGVSLGLLAALVCQFAAPSACAGPMADFGGGDATRLAVVAPEISPWPRDPFDLERPSLLSLVRRPSVRLEWMSEDVVRWREEGVASGRVAARSAGLKAIVPVGQGAVGVWLGGDRGNGSYQAMRDLALNLPQESIAVIYGRKLGRKRRCGLLWQRRRTRGRAQGTVLGDLINDAPFGRLDAPWRGGDLVIEGAASWGNGEAALSLDLSEASWPVSLTNGPDTASLDLGHRGLGFRTEVWQQAGRRVELYAFGGSVDASGSGGAFYDAVAYGGAETGAYRAWLGMGAAWQSSARTVAVGESWWQTAQLSARALTGVPTAFGFASPGQELAAQANAGLSVTSVRIAARHRMGNNVIIGAGVQASHVDADASLGWRETYTWNLKPPSVGGSCDTLDGARLYIAGMGAHKQCGDFAVDLALAMAFAQTRRKPSPPVAPPPPPEVSHAHQVSGGLAVAAAITWQR